MSGEVEVRVYIEMPYSRKPLEETVTIDRDEWESMDDQSREDYIREEGERPLMNHFPWGWEVKETDV